MKKQIVVAGGIQRAAALAKELGIPDSDVLACSPRSIQSGAGRGLTADVVLIDDTAWPIGDREVETLCSTLIASGGQVYAVTRVVPGAATASD